MLEFFLDEMPERVPYGNVTVVVPSLPLLSEDRAREVGFGQFRHQPSDLGLDVRLVFPQYIDRARRVRVAVLRRERKLRAHPYPQVQGALRVRKDVGYRRERRPPVTRELRRWELGERLEVTASRVGEVREPRTYRLHFRFHLKHLRDREAPLHLRLSLPGVMERPSRARPSVPRRWHFRSQTPCARRTPWRANGAAQRGPAQGVPGPARGPATATLSSTCRRSSAP